MHHRRRRSRRARRSLVARLRRHPVAYWTVTAVAVTGLVATATSLDGEPPGASGLGRLRRVPVARHTIEPGELVEADDVEWRDLPSGSLPSEPLAAELDRRAATTIFTGEPVVAARLAPDGASALAARIPADRQAVALPVTVGAPPLEPGDVVDLLSVASPDPSSGRAHRVARAAVVVDVGDEVVTVAVDDDDVRAVATAAATGAVVISLDGPD